MKVWVDMTASAHVLVFRPLIRLLRQQGHDVEVTAREYAQTLELLELHGLQADVIGRHGGRSRLGKARSLGSRLRALHDWARGRAFDVALAHGSHELTLTARRLGVPSATTFQYEGLKEEYYLADFEPDRHVLDPWPLDPERVLVVLRPPPDVSLYHRQSNPLFPQTLPSIGRAERVHPLVPPR